MNVSPHAQEFSLFTKLWHAWTRYFYYSFSTTPQSSIMWLCECFEVSYCILQMKKEDLFRSWIKPAFLNAPLFLPPSNGIDCTHTQYYFLSLTLHYTFFFSFTNTRVCHAIFFFLFLLLFCSYIQSPISYYIFIPYFSHNLLLTLIFFFQFYLNSLFSILVTLLLLKLIGQNILRPFYMKLRSTSNKRLTFLLSLLLIVS